jgi:hypothetical protein
MPPTTPAPCGAVNAAGAPCKSPPLTGTGRCLSHADAQTRRRFGFGGPRARQRPAAQAPAALIGDRRAGRAGDGPAHRDPPGRVGEAAEPRRGRAEPAERVGYDQALEALVACCRVRDRAEADGDEPLAAEARRRFPGFVDKVGEVAGAGPWPR